MSNNVSSTDCEFLSMYEIWNSDGSYSRVKLMAFHELRRVKNDK